MKLSHSKLSTILSCPMTYYLSYVQGISKKEEKSALAVGSAVHWGIEHNTEDLTEYFGSDMSAYTRDQLLAEAMVHGYLKHKDELFNEMLTDPETGERLELKEEHHELYITGMLDTKKFEEKHKFVGIVDLLLLTNKGFVLIDYKTSTYEPQWDNYLDQIYRYIFLLRSEYPDIPVVKIGIVNIRKTAIRQKKTENYEQFLNRMKFEYDLNDEHYVNYHEFPVSSLNADHINNYIGNLSMMADTAQTIADNKLFFINYGAANGTYGKSDFWDIFYHTPDAHLLYKISDHVWNEEEGVYIDSRDCVPIDMMVIDHDNVLNKYELFKSLIPRLDELDETFVETLRKNYVVDETLLGLYFDTYIHELYEKS